MIFDTTFTEKLGFTKIPNRGNVALSQARHGLYVLSDGSGIRKKGSRVYCIAELLRIVDGKELWVGSGQQLVSKDKRAAQAEVAEQKARKKIPLWIAS